MHLCNFLNNTIIILNSLERSSKAKMYGYHQKIKWYYYCIVACYFMVYCSENAKNRFKSHSDKKNLFLLSIVCQKFTGIGTYFSWVEWKSNNKIHNPPYQWIVFKNLYNKPGFYVFICNALSLGNSLLLLLLNGYKNIISIYYSCVWNFR